MDDMWYDIDCTELSGHIANCVHTTMYTSKVNEAMIDGTSFFGMGNNDDWKLFFDTVGMKSFPHMRMLRKWVVECNEKEKIVDDAPGLAPTEGKHPRTVMPLGAVMARSVSTVTQSKKIRDDIGGSNDENTNMDAPTKSLSPSDSMSDKARMDFFQDPSEIFTKKTGEKHGGKTLLKNAHPEAHKSHIRNFAIVRSWFENYATDKVLHDYLYADFKSNTTCKEACRRYIQSRMHELLPFKFTNPETGATLEMPWPENYLFEQVLSRKHEWKKIHGHKSPPSDGLTKAVREVPITRVAFDSDKEIAMQYCQNSDVYALDLYASELKQGLENLKRRESIHLVKEEISDQCHKRPNSSRKSFANHFASVFGRGIPISIHVLNTIRCWKIRYISTKFTKPSENKRREHMWVPLLIPGSTSTSALNEIQVNQMQAGKEYYIPRTHCSMTPLPPVKLAVSSSSLSSGDCKEPHLFDAEDLEDTILAEENTNRAQPSSDFRSVEEDPLNSTNTNSSGNKTIILDAPKSSEEVSIGDDGNTGTDILDTDDMTESHQSQISASSNDTTEPAKPQVKRLKCEESCENSQQPASSQIYYKRKSVNSSQTRSHANSKVVKEENTTQALREIQVDSQENVPGKQRKKRVCNNGKENTPSFTMIRTAVEVKARSKLIMGKVKVEQENDEIQTGAETCPVTKLQGDDDNGTRVDIDVEILSPQSIQVVCMRAMGLLNISMVEAQVKTWISGMNSQVGGANKPFKGHSRMDQSELLAMVARWSIESGYVIIRDPPEVSMDGVQRLFPECVKRRDE